MGISGGGEMIRWGPRVVDDSMLAWLGCCVRGLAVHCCPKPDASDGLGAFC
jgi:hypothetical protein